MDRVAPVLFEPAFGGVDIRSIQATLEIHLAEYAADGVTIPAVMDWMIHLATELARKSKG